MKTILRAVSHLYPRAWRQRYGEEFDALIDDLAPRWRDVIDTIAGALIMQISRLALAPVVLGLAGAVVGAALALTIPPGYASSSSVLVQMADPAADPDGLKTMIEGALAHADFDRKAVSVTVRGGMGTSMMLDVSGAADSALAAQQTTQRVLRSIIEANLVAAEGRGRNSGAQFRIVDAASLPDAPRRHTERSAATGGALGIAVGGIFAFVSHRRRRKTT